MSAAQFKGVRAAKLQGETERKCCSLCIIWHERHTFAEQEDVIEQVVHLWGGLQQCHQHCPLRAAYQAI